MAKKRIIVQKLLADAPKGRRQKVQLVIPAAKTKLAPPAEEPGASWVYLDQWSIPISTVDSIVKLCDTLMVALLLGATLAVIIWKAKHTGVIPHDRSVYFFGG
jgi:hypothetical protein